MYEIGMGVYILLVIAPSILGLNVSSSSHKLGFVFCYSAGDQNWNLVHTKQVSYHKAISPVLSFCVFIAQSHSNPTSVLAVKMPRPSYSGFSDNIPSGLFRSCHNSSKSYKNNNNNKNPSSFVSSLLRIFILIKSS